MQEQFDRLASVHGEVVLIHAGEPLRYSMFITQWCKDHEDFTEIVEPRSVQAYGAGPAGREQAERLLSHNPDEVWKFESTPGSMRHQDHAIFPEFWALAAVRGKICRRIRYQNRRTPYKSYVEAPETDADGFPAPVRVRAWDADRNGVQTRSARLEAMSKTHKGKYQRNRRRRLGL